MRLAAVLSLLVAATVLSGCLQAPANGWGAQATQLDGLRHAGATGRTIKVAILDTGIDLGHPSLAHLGDGRLRDGEMVAYADLLGSSRGPHDRGGHGSFVAGVLAASAPDGLAAVTGLGAAVEGLAPGVELLVGRACDGASCPLTAVWKGLDWAIDNDADIVSLSLGYTPTAIDGQGAIVERMRQSLARAEEKGILVVAAAGNTDGPVLFPAKEPTVLAVGAVDKDLKPRHSSARGYGSLKPDLVAPGEGIVGPDGVDGRIAYDGTSAAVPFVVAAAALAMAEVGDPEDHAAVDLLRRALLESALPVPGQRVPHDPWAGHGLVQARSLLDHYRVLMELYVPEEPEPTGRPWDEP